LENLILSFAQKRRQEDESMDDATASSGATNSTHDAAVLATERGTPLEDDPGKLVNNEQAGTTYVDASHWQAILDDVGIPFYASARVSLLKLTMYSLYAA
jgi:hypothetical protein